MVIDPPWRFHCVSTAYNRRRGHGYYAEGEDFAYRTMPDGDLLAFDLDRFCDPESCGVFIWTTHGKLRFALSELLDAWRLKYSALLTWHKNGGTSLNGIHKNSEFVVFAYRGRQPIRRNSSALHTAFTAPTTGHSRKPEKFYNMIRATCPLPRIDVFARRRHPGFDAWGDQVEEGLQSQMTDFAVRANRKESKGRGGKGTT